jgi:hypothetical protein
MGIPPFNTFLATMLISRTWNGRITLPTGPIKAIRYSVPAGVKKSVNAVWSYGDPLPALEQIKGHVAFYPERVDEIAEQLPT